MLRVLLPLLILATATPCGCVAPVPRVGAEGEVARVLHAPLDRAFRETVAAIHATGVPVPRDQRPEETHATIRTDTLLVRLERLEGGERTEARVLYHDRDAVRARSRGTALLDAVSDRLSRR